MKNKNCYITFVKVIDTSFNPSLILAYKLQIGQLLCIIFHTFYWEYPDTAFWHHIK